MRSPRSLVGVCAVTAVLLSPLVALAAGDGRTWQLVASPSPSPVSLLSGVAVAGQRDVWAVGSSSAAEFGQPFQTLVEHWDGSGWSIVPSPSPGTTSSLSGVAALSGDDAWAVGSSSAGTLVERWDGTSWSVVPSPSPDPTSRLSGVAALSDDDAWAVGSSSAGTLVEHWDGTYWSIVPSPSPGALSGVTALSASDVWAVGSSGGATLVEHWDGASWSVVPSPSPGAFSGLSAVATVSPRTRRNVWAVGGSFDGSGNATLIEHWDGTSWSVVASPSPGRFNALLGVSAVAQDDVWAVGNGTTNPALPFAAQTLVEHWDGSSWSIVPSPTRDDGSSLAAVVFGTGERWAVGSSHAGAPVGDFTLVQRYARP